MKKVKKLFVLVAFSFFIFGLAANADAQRRRPAARKTSTAAAQNSVNAAEVKTSAAKVSTQIKNLTRFIYLLGGIARNIEDNDKNARGKRLPQNETNKQNVISAIRNFRAGLIQLETDFTSKPALRLYNFQIQGISDLSGQAEDQATAGHFTDAGNTLISVVEKLSDTLVSLP